MSARTHLWHVVPVCVATALSLCMTYPVWLRPASTLIGDGPSDAMGTIYGLWERRMRDEGKIRVGDIALTAAPLERVQPLSRPRWILMTDYLLTPLARRLGEVTAYNLWVLATFFLTALTFPLLVRAALQTQVADSTSLVSATIVGTVAYTLCPYHLTRAQHHDTLAAIQWLPLYAAALLTFWRKPTFLNALGTALSFSLAFLWNYYLGYMAVVMTLVYVLMFLARGALALLGDRKKSMFSSTTAYSSTRTFLAAAAIVPVAAAAVLPFTWPILKEVWRCHTTGQAMREAHPYVDLVMYGARPINYLLPPRTHPVLGRFAPDVQQWITRPKELRNPNEARYLPRGVPYREGLELELTIYLGWTTLLLALIGAIYSLWQRRITPHLCVAAVFFLATAAAGFLWSLPPKVEVLGMTLHTPPHYLYPLLPMFRASARFGLLVMLSVSALASLGTYAILQEERRLSQRGKSILCGVLVLLLSFEFTHVPPLRYLVVKPVPAVYRWLQQQPGKFVIAEYPMYRTFDSGFFGYRFWQMFHRKPMVNGAMPKSEMAKVEGLVRDPSDAAAVTVLRMLNVRYLVVHTQLFQNAPRFRIPDAHLVQSFSPSGDMVYRLEPMEPNPIKTFLDRGELSAERILYTCLNLGVDAPALRLRLGELCAEKGDLQSAARHFETLAQMQPTNALARLRLAGVYFYLKRFAEGYQQAQTLTCLAPEFPEGYFLKGLLCTHLEGKELEAALAFRRCLQLEPSHEATQLMRHYLQTHPAL